MYCYTAILVHYSTVLLSYFTTSLLYYSTTLPQVEIDYGTAATSNAQFVGHYGFLDPGAAAADEALLRAHPEVSGERGRWSQRRKGGRRGGGLGEIAQVW